MIVEKFNGPGADPLNKCTHSFSKLDHYSTKGRIVCSNEMV
jgi:hypothetical protein